MNNRVEHLPCFDKHDHSMATIGDLRQVAQHVDELLGLRPQADQQTLPKVTIKLETGQAIEVHAGATAEEIRDLIAAAQVKGPST